MRVAVGIDVAKAFHWVAVVLTKGGEAKSDPRHAQTIADQLRLRSDPGDWRVVDQPDELSTDLRLLVSRRRELVVEQTRRLARLREMLTSYTTPDQIRRAGRRRITEYLLRRGVRRSYADSLAQAIDGSAPPAPSAGAAPS